MLSNNAIGKYSLGLCAGTIQPRQLSRGNLNFKPQQSRMSGRTSVGRRGLRRFRLVAFYCSVLQRPAYGPPNPAKTGTPITACRDKTGRSALPVAGRSAPLGGKRNFCRIRRVKGVSCGELIALACWIQFLTSLLTTAVPGRRGPSRSTQL